MSRLVYSVKFVLDTGKSEQVFYFSTRSIITERFLKDKYEYLKKKYALKNKWHEVYYVLQSKMNDW